MAEHLPSMLEALGSISSTMIKKKKKMEKKRQVKDCEKILLTHVSDREIVVRLYKELL
jgi:hypothetical protein